MLVPAVIGFLGAVLGAVASYLGAQAAAKKSNAAASVANTVALAQALLDSDDPTHRVVGTALLAASVRAIADSDDTPDRIKQATRSGDLADAIDEVRTIEDSDGEQVEIELAEEARDGEEGSSDPQAG